MKITMDLTIGDIFIKAACVACKIANDFDCEVVICGDNLKPVTVNPGSYLPNIISKLFDDDEHSAFVCVSDVVNRFILNHGKANTNS